MTELKQNRHTGDVGEHRVNIMLNELGFSVAKPSPDPGVDILAMSWETEQAYRDITFYFQVKERRSPEDIGIAISQNLEEFVTTTPVFVIRTSGTAFENRFSVCILHRWLLKNRGRNRHSKSLWIPNVDFSSVTNLSMMRSLLIEEAARVSGRAPSMWRAAAHYPSVLDESEILFGKDNLYLRELTELVIQRVKQIVQPATSEALFQALAVLRGGRTGNTPICALKDNVITRWLEDMGNPPSSEFKNIENRLVCEFTVSVERYLQGYHFSMPKYKWEDVNTWRILLGVYPFTLDLVKEVLLHSNRWSLNAAKGKWSLDEVKATFGLLGAAACSEDDVVRNRASALIDKIKRQHGYLGSAQNEIQYGFQHAYYWALAQENYKHVKRVQDFLLPNKDRDNWELRLNRGYYSVLDDSVLRRTTLSRIENPRRRDLNLIPLLELQLELVMKYGVVNA